MHVTASLPFPVVKDFSFTDRVSHNPTPRQEKRMEAAHQYGCFRKRQAGGGAYWDALSLREARSGANVTKYVT